MTSSHLQTHQSLERGLRVIEATAAVGGAATLSEIARKTALPRSTTHHIVRALVDFGYLVQDGDSRPYRLGPKLFRLTGTHWTGAQLAEMAMPFLDELSRRTGEGTEPRRAARWRGHRGGQARVRWAGAGRAGGGGSAAGVLHGGW